MKVMEKVIEYRVRKNVKVVKIQIGFMAGRRLTDVFFQNSSAAGKLADKEERPMNGLY